MKTPLVLLMAGVCLIAPAFSQTLIYGSREIKGDLVVDGQTYVVEHGATLPTCSAAGAGPIRVFVPDSTGRLYLCLSSGWVDVAAAIDAAAITTGTLAINRIPTGINSSSVALGDHTIYAIAAGKPNGYWCIQTVSGVPTLVSSSGCPGAGTGGGGGGGGSGLAWGSLTNSTWAALTNSQWLSLGN